MSTGEWSGVLIRFAKHELENIDAYCKKYSLKRTDLIRSSIRDKIANTDPATGVTKEKDNPIDLIPVIDSINSLKLEFECLEKKFDSNSEGKEATHSSTEERIAEAILQVKQRTKDPLTTTEKLAERIKRLDPSLEPFLFASPTNGISLYENVLSRLHQEGMVHRRSSVIIDLKRDAEVAQRKKN